MLREMGMALKGRQFYMDWPNDRCHSRRQGQLYDLLIGETAEANCQWISSSSDWGVVGNCGRRGAAHAPAAIKAAYFKQAKRSARWKYFIEEVACQDDEASNFSCAQERESVRIQNILQQCPERAFVHLGGGHDHAYPMIKAFMQACPRQNLHVINIDAHLDTRTDQYPHSGTPFRQLLKLYPQRLRISQVGILPSANANSNYQNLDRPMEIHTIDALQLACPDMSLPAVYQWARENLQKQNGELQFLSLDCDALCSQVMEAVSAVNPHGLPFPAVQALFRFYRDHNPAASWKIGIYELNPVYDNLSQKGAKAVSALLYDTFYGNSYLNEKPR